LNFNSPKAYGFFIECKDTHKAWESFEIFFHGTMLELIYNYVEYTNEDPTPSGFLNWQYKIESATLKSMLQIVLTFGLGIYTQRVGDRNNDASVSDAGRYAFLDWFYGFNHPLYREIDYRDLMTKSVLPEEVKNQIRSNVTFSTKNTQGRNQGEIFFWNRKCNDRS